MHIESAIIADYVQENHGKLYITGGGIDTLFAHTVPVRHLSIGVAFRLVLSASELGRAYQLEIVLVNADGGRLAAVNVNVNSEAPLESTAWPFSLPLAINFAQIEFPAYGDYQFELLVNNSCLHTMPFRVLHPPAIPRPS